MLFYPAVAILLLQIFSFQSVFGIVCKDKEICSAKADEVKQFLFRKLTELSSGVWDEKQLTHELSNAFYSEGSPFRNELRRLKLEVAQEEKPRFKASVKLNEQLFFIRYNLPKNLKSYETTVLLGQLNIFEGLEVLCSSILRDARHVAEPNNSENNCYKDHCDAATTKDALDDDSTYEGDGEGDGGVESTSADDNQPTSRDLPGSINVSAPNTSDNAESDNADAPKTPINDVKSAPNTSENADSDNADAPKTPINDVKSASNTSENTGSDKADAPKTPINDVKSASDTSEDADSDNADEPDTSTDDVKSASNTSENADSDNADAPKTPTAASMPATTSQAPSSQPEPSSKGADKQPDTSPKDAPAAVQQPDTSSKDKPAAVNPPAQPPATTSSPAVAANVSPKFPKAK